ncbi:MAG: hypothetical protein PHQ18_03780 [Patescibacteria group bacterium]|nr:hypothetical protein [Patescibacteria group bacterium]
MINIISKSILSKRVTGPGKVVKNLIKGLEKIGYPYVINQRLDSCKRLWIHDDVAALKKIKDLSENTKVMAGPNLYIVPRNVPKNIFTKNSILIQPSKWVEDFWRGFGFNQCDLDSWATGIDIEIFTERKISNVDKVLIYFKQREKEELHFLEQSLKEKKIDYDIIIYGSYKQEEYIKKLQNTKYIIWLGRQESQGIALEEALSMNIPVLVWDVENIGHWVPNEKEKNIFSKEENAYENTTSAFYFDDKCGIKFKDHDSLSASIDIMENDWKNFEPRKYILENLSLEKQARDFVNLYDKHFGLSFEEGLVEKQFKKGKWKNDKFFYKNFILLKDFIKKFI